MSTPTAETKRAPVVSLDDKWTVERGRILLNGTQALARVLLAQSARDRKAGLNTAGFISGYRGSPLGSVDTTLWSIRRRLDEARITFVPGVNEDIAATAVRGTQQLDAVPEPLVDGVFAAWYGKGPGVDRSGDALKHGNYAGAHRHGGVVVFYGDDHGGKSSTVAHHSEQAVAAAMIPSLYPADVGEIISYGLLGYALSRYSGSWVGLKLVNEVVEQTSTAEIDLEATAPLTPAYGELPPEGLHIRSGPFGPLREEEIVTDHRLPHVRRFVRANNIDRTAFRSPTPRLGLVTAGKSYSDTRQALAVLGLDDTAAAALGLSLYKVGCIWPLETVGLATFVEGHDRLLVIEEKVAFLEPQIAAALINSQARPRLVGKFDESGAPLIPQAAQLDPVGLALVIVGQLKQAGVSDERLSEAAAALGARTSPGQSPGVPTPRRAPYFCSGCPHSRSTKIPDGSLSMSGIGCHTMAAFVRPDETLLPTQMGGEGGNWLGMAPFTRTPHMFQNMGDGTYYHSGLLAIRAAVASRVNITYKILYNDAVAMTGGQPIDGPISVAEIAAQVRHEGVGTVVVLSDNPDVHRANPALQGKGVRVEHRDQLDVVQRDMRALTGCTVLIYEQTCAAEKRRRRKRGSYPDPPKRLFISEAVCEGCGDCSVQSTCVSLTPVDTGEGVKRKIDQSSCNKDFSCLNGFCPSFISVHGAEPRKSAIALPDLSAIDDLPAPAQARPGAESYNMMVAGIGGTGVITVGAILGMAAHIEGKAASLFDMTGLAQKNGAVYSHIRIANDPSKLHAQKLGHGEADLLLAFDLVAGLADESTATFATGRTLALVNTDVAATAAFQFDRNASVDTRLLRARLSRVIGDGRTVNVPATALANSLLGDSLAANLMMVGVAAQRGLLPVGTRAIEQAIELNGAAVPFNLAAFRLGRLFAARPETVLSDLPESGEASPQTVDTVIARQSERLTGYQDSRYADRYRTLVERVREREQAAAPGNEALTLAVARGYAKVLAYKDEYEVARLLSSSTLKVEFDRAFADGGRYGFNLAPPVLGGRPVNGRPPKREFDARLMRPLLGILARAKFLRHTIFDPFGGTHERRLERALICDYEGLIESVLEALSPNNHAAAVELLTLIDEVRGYGPVKVAAVGKYRAAIPAAQAAFARASSIASTAA